MDLGLKFDAGDVNLEQSASVLDIKPNNDELLDLSEAKEIEEREAQEKEHWIYLLIALCIAPLYLLLRHRERMAIIYQSNHAMQQSSTHNTQSVSLSDAEKIAHIKGHYALKLQELKLQNK